MQVDQEGREEDGMDVSGDEAVIGGPGTVRNLVREAFASCEAEAFAEHDGELGSCLEPFPRRAFPLVGGAVQDEP